MSVESKLRKKKSFLIYTERIFREILYKNIAIISIQYTHSVLIFFAFINVAKFAISVWRFSPHCVVKFTIVYSTNYKTV